MSNIEQRAREFVEKLRCGRNGDCNSCEILADCTWITDKAAFVAGAESEHEELTRWNDPKEPPQDDRSVLLKLRVPTTNDIRYIVGHYNENKWVGFLIGLDKIIGWREIHE